MLLESTNVGVHSPHIFRIYEEECLLGVKPKCEDVFHIFIGQFSEFSQITSFLVEILLIIGNLHHERHIKGLLKILVENERQHVAQMKGF
jgi:hypothetical protein